MTDWMLIYFPQRRLLLERLPEDLKARSTSSLRCFGCFAMKSHVVASCIADMVAAAKPAGNLRKAPRLASSLKWRQPHLAGTLFSPVFRP
jgi:hypothetical protein